MAAPRRDTRKCMPDAGCSRSIGSSTPTSSSSLPMNTAKTTSIDEEYKVQVAPLKAKKKKRPDAAVLDTEPSD